MLAKPSINIEKRCTIISMPLQEVDTISCILNDVLIAQIFAKNQMILLFYLHIEDCYVEAKGYTKPQISCT